MEGSFIVIDRGKPRKTKGEIINKDLDFNGLFIDMVYNRILYSVI